MEQEQDHNHKCLICGGVTVVEEIPSQLKEFLREIYQTFLKYLAAERRGECLPDTCDDVFPFCQLCQNVPVQVHRLDQNIQSDTRSIKQLILKANASIRRQAEDLGVVSSTSEKKYFARFRGSFQDEDQELETIEVSCPSSEVEFQVDKKSPSSYSTDDLVVEKSRVGVGMSTESDRESESPIGAANVEVQKPLTFNQAMVQTGPTTSVYLENYKVEKVGRRAKQGMDDSDRTASKRGSVPREPKYKCELCSFSTAYLYSINRHAIKVHKDIVAQEDGSIKVCFAKLETQREPVTLPSLFSSPSTSRSSRHPPQT